MGAAHCSVPPSQHGVFSDPQTQRQRLNRSEVSEKNDLLAKLRDWLHLQNVTWCGTPGELALITDGSADELVELIESNSTALEHMGVRASLARNSSGLRQIVVSRTEALNAEHERKPVIVRTAGLDHSSVDIPAEGHNPSIAQYSGPLMSSVLLRADSVATWRLRLISLLTTGFVLSAGFLFFVGSGRIPFRLTHGHVPANGAVKRAGPDSTPVAQNLGTAPAPETVEGTDSDLMGFPALLAAARSGNLEAQHLVGLKYLHGDGVEPNSTTAADWFYRAALRGHPAAQYELASNYASGTGMPADPVAAYTWFIIAYANGDNRSEDRLRAIGRQLLLSDIAQIRFNIGEMYVHGIGVQQDPVAAYAWYRLAEAAGDRRAKKAEAALAGNMSNEEISRARSRAAEWLDRHRVAR